MSAYDNPSLEAANPFPAPFRSFTTREFLTTCGYIGDISKPVAFIVLRFARPYE
jgi:hypothetical protein